MKEYAALVSLAKTRIDRGFSRVGRELKPEDAAAKAMTLLAARAVAMSNALVLLAMHQHANEALPLLRSLLETVVRMRWIAQKDSLKRAREFLAESESPLWDDFFSTKRLEERLAALGIAGALGREILSGCRGHLRANAGGLPWSHVFAESSSEPGMAPERLAQLTAAAMGHALKSLDLIWPSQFEGAEDVWHRAHVESGREDTTREE